MDRETYLLRIDRIIADVRASANRSNKPKQMLRVVGLDTPTPTSADELVRVPTRRYHLRRIRWLANDWGLAWMVDQATLGHPIETLEDDDLRALLGDMEQGRRCCVEGVGFDDAGLVRTIEKD